MDFAVLLGDWVMGSNQLFEEVSGAANAMHRVGTVQQAYQRSDLLKSAAADGDWADFDQ